MLCYNFYYTNWDKWMLSDQLPKENHHLELLLNITRRLGRSPDLDSFLLEVVLVGCQLTQSTSCSILLYEQETDLLKFVACPVDQIEILKTIRVPIDRSLAGWVYKNRKPLLVSNVQENQLHFKGVDSDTGFTTQSLAAVPLFFQGNTIGVLEAVNKLNNEKYSDVDLQNLETLASQSAIAIMNYLLFDEIKRAYDEVQALEKMKTNFIAITSHELRTPLGLVIGHASFLNELISDSEQKQQLDVIIRSADRLKSIVEDLSNVNSIQMGSAKIHQHTISLTKLVRKIIKRYSKEAASKNIALLVDIPEEHLSIDADEEKITIAINNLVKNALTFTDPGGQIKIEAERLPGYIQVSVSDNGIGIPASDLPRVFDRFYQVQSHLTRRHGGMGLGLSVAKAMVELHQGQIWVESIEGKGSIFSFLLPLQAGRSARKAHSFIA
jgi:signal transduction histidine kinase